MFDIVGSIIDGILTGAVYGLAAMGLTLVWGAMRIINLAHGTMITGGIGLGTSTLSTLTLLGKGG